jgi:E-phenylitaconyl-CoA hydratase
MALKVTIEDWIGTITLNRPEAMNALDPETHVELADVFREFENDPNVRTIILTGEGSRAFCVGADLKKTMPPPESFAQLTFGSGRSLRTIDVMMMDKPIICAINGLALGGGLELALACDIRIAAEHVKLGLPEVKIGSIPGAGGTQRLPRTIGMSDAMLLLLTGDAIPAEEALRIGLISKVVSADTLMEEARSIAERISCNAPLSVRAIKSLVRRGLESPLEAAIQEEHLVWGVLRDTEDRIEGRVAFKEKRKPVYKGR